MGLPEQFTSGPQFTLTSALGERRAGPATISVASGSENDPGTYTLDFGAFSFDENFERLRRTSERPGRVCRGRARRLLRATNREPMIRDLSVVEDPAAHDLRRAGRRSAHRCVDLRPPRCSKWRPRRRNAPDMVEQLFKTWLTDQTMNGFLVPARPDAALVLDSFPRTADGKPT